jgi:hypothetical protein
MAFDRRRFEEHYLDLRETIIAHIANSDVEESVRELANSFNEQAIFTNEGRNLFPSDILIGLIDFYIRNPAEFTNEFYRIREQQLRVNVRNYTEDQIEFTIRIGSRPNRCPSEIFINQKFNDLVRILRNYEPNLPLLQL